MPPPDERVLRLEHRLEHIETSQQEVRQVLFDEGTGIHARLIRIEEQVKQVNGFCDTVKKGMARVITGLLVFGISGLVGVVWYLTR